MWFSKVPGYLFDKQRTPYLTEAKELTLAQSQYELVAYGIFVASLYGIIALAAGLTFLDSNNFIYLFWIACSITVIGSIFGVVRNYDLTCSYIISVAPSIIVLICFYEAFIADASLFSLTIFVCLFLLSCKYGWRVIKIVSWQKYNENNEINNSNKKKVWGQ
ncbi:hypothetical protein N8310_02760 [Pseudomonadota bacterium]|nr:hypothetical protein [Pseudomonadota bacterium]